jgi:FtsP/CotA-like multicopper oxidase with cupredoxin domain
MGVATMTHAANLVSRRQILGAGVALPMAMGATRVWATETPANAPPPMPPMQVKPDYTLDIAAKSIAPLGKPGEATLVNGVFPGPEIRYKEGDTFRVTVNNRLAVPTSVHWHGMIVPNYMDGVPGVTQAAMTPGASVFYEYPLRQTGTNWYHSHYELQEQTGLAGPLVVEARNEPYSYDQDVVVFLSDWLDQPADSVVPQLRMQQPPTAATKMRKPGGFPLPNGKPFEVDVNYPGYLINGKGNADPWALKVKAGDRVRLRIINGSASSFFRMALDGHDLLLISADGQPITPLSCSNLLVGAAERYDALVTIQNAGSFILRAAALGTDGQVVGAIHTTNSPRRATIKPPTFEGKAAGFNDYAALKSPYPTTLPDGPIKTFTIDLGGQMMKYLWSMEGQYYPEIYSPDGKADPLKIQLGDRVRIRFTNSTMMYHPMHLHGHFFRVLPQAGAWDTPNAPLKDSVSVGPKQKVDIEFYADNPGRWFFHCHNMYHMLAGMARVVEYTV